MLSFVDLDRSLGLVPGAVVTQLGRVDLGCGREGLFRTQVPALLTELAHRARIASVTASSALEGVVVSDPARAAAILARRPVVLRNRSEQEFSGYRSALDYLFGQDWRPLDLGLLLHLHRELFAETSMPAGRLKESDNLVVDRSPAGAVEVRFVPVPAARTEFCTVELVERYLAASAEGRHHRVLLAGLFVLDLLTFHPFGDGNGRVVRALTNALLDDAGYSVGRYVSLEQLIADSVDEYYRSLLASTHGWHEQRHDPWPWLSYFVGVLARAYDQFERGTATVGPPASKQQRVRDYVRERAPQVFRISDVRGALPGVSDATIRLALEQLKREGVVRPDGPGRSAVWVRAQQPSD